MFAPIHRPPFKHGTTHLAKNDKKNFLENKH